MELNRRNFLKCSAAAGAATAATLGCAGAIADEAAFALPEDLALSDFAESSVELEMPTEFVLEETYDIVVVGAGCAGVPAVVTALDEGATVACLQKGSAASANGRAAAGVYLDGSTEAGIQRYISDWAELNGYRINRRLFNYWAHNSGETQSWLTKKYIEAGLEPAAGATDYSLVYEDGNKIAYFYSRNSVAVFMMALAEKAEQDGAAFFYDTPAVQIVTDEMGRVTGVIGKRAETGEYVKLNATKAVILAAGDYQSNNSLKKRYCEDVINFTTSLTDRTGDGLILGVLAGGTVVPAGHAHQIHANFATNGTLVGPYLHLNPQGKRFMNEGLPMTSWNTEMKYDLQTQEDVWVYRFFDSAVEEKFPGTGPLALANQLIETNKEEFMVDGRLCRADTLEELVEKLGLPFEETMASIAHYNELCATGADSDFGKKPEYMQALDTPPYFGVENRLRCCAINGGLTVDEHYQVVNAAGVPIEGLFAAGTNGGDLCGGINWTMPTGLSNGHCFTAGRYTVIYALHGTLEPANPASFDEIAPLLKDADGEFAWDNPAKARTTVSLW